MSTKRSQRELVEKYLRGERITKADAQYSMFDAEDTEKAKTCRHSWRCIVCWDSEADIDECRNCGRQTKHACNFDEDMS